MIYHLYRRPKKNGAFWMDLRVNDCRYREPLGTRGKGEAHELMLKRVEQLKVKAPDPSQAQQVLWHAGRGHRYRRYATETWCSSLTTNA